MSKTVRLTPSMRTMLENAAAGRNLCAGVFGRSAHGGAQGTRVALIRRGLIDWHADQITDAGRAALAPITDQGKV